jgi:ribose transport system ATP-binding protein
VTAALSAIEAEGSNSTPSVLRIAGLSKRFGGARALDNVSLEVRIGEVHGLLGQNGSGKSTLIKILSGFHEPDEGGKIWVNGKEVELPIPVGSFHSLGISFVHQHLGLIPTLTVLENLLIGDLASELNWRINWLAESRRARELFQRYDLALDPASGVQRLSPVERALLAIVRAFDQLQRERARTGNAGLLILDEPTPFLPAHDVKKLFRLVREIVNDGASVIFVSHDIDEVLTITDRATVLRDGQVAGSFETNQVTKADIVRMIVGRHVELTLRKLSSDFSEVAAAVRLTHATNEIVDDVNIELRPGEVLGLTGLIGSGYDEVVYLAYGGKGAASGTLEIGEKRLELNGLSPKTAIEHGCVLIPGDRQSSAAVGSLSVIENLSLPVLAKVTNPWLLNGAALKKNAVKLNEMFDVRPRDPTLPIGSLSGGNQQKVVLAKWFQVKPRLILLDEPTQGVDVGAREQVFEVIRDASRSGACVICASSDFEQLAAICDRVGVFSRGRLVLELHGEELSKSSIAEACYRAADNNQ